MISSEAEETVKVENGEENKNIEDVTMKEENPTPAEKNEPEENVEVKTEKPKQKPVSVEKAVKIQVGPVAEET